IGAVAALGPGVTTDSLGQPLHSGDRVVFPYFRSCGHCEACLAGETVGCSNRFMAMLGNCEEPPHFVGGFAQFFYLPPHSTLLRVPDLLPDELTAGINCALSQVIYGFERVGLKAGERVVLQGAGGLGLYATVVAREQGAGQVVVIDSVPERLHLAERFGADSVIDMRQYPTPAERVRAVRKLSGGGAHVVVDLTGNPAAMDEGIKMTRTLGRYLEIGNILTGQPVELDPSRLVFGNRTLLGVSLYEPRSLKKALDFLARTIDRYPYKEAFGAAAYPLSQINRALVDTAERRVARAAIRPWDEERSTL
ncbi:MAG: zinc-binding dehydrogenase, partial [Ktedonobacteraceae bacterium]|nr:zinc-binding dehydrogenase [Ktedonobacteraceae bacterium]